MEFRFDVKHLLHDEITKVDNNLIIGNWQSSTRNRVEYQQLYQIINAIGEASSFSQGLNNVITNAEKLHNSDHLLYLMKEDDEASGVTLVVGMLKVGRKKLFLLDINQRTKETAPLCVLDFYIHESRQRRGYGKRLFDYMLRDQNVTPEFMAVDKPSDKFLGFLHKHYNLYKQVPQINNFVVFESFFTDRPIGSEEAKLTQVTRSPRANSPERNGSPGGSRRSSTSSHSAGLPSTSRETNSMADILHGRPDRHMAAVRLCPRYQNTLEMRGPTSGSDTPYSHNSYSASRTPSNAGSPLRTPWGGSPPRTPHTPHTPPTTTQPASRKKSADLVDGQSLEGSIAPTPATSPDHSPAKEAREEGEGREEAVQQQPGEEDGMVVAMEKMSVSATPQSPARGPELCGLMAMCKNNQWRDSVSRSSAALQDRMSSGTGSTMSGVLHENDSVHGHLKFHHHALW
ncbi:alpha-tubulin N-acetyltransferase-like isoform X2 [Eriocheir sinensis]|uniref:alpha-tubulin N-acetyltransferase-like isoform X2 n=1 Tax=Eriocheir sinensis TaxID=95602 RepID=UPI0021C5D700|nr:alpha-tubulin N-acetyltransferase-like isoform X2 [Eriocheir sinensis]